MAAIPGVTEDRNIKYGADEWGYRNVAVAFPGARGLQLACAGPGGVLASGAWRSSFVATEDRNFYDFKPTQETKPCGGRLTGAQDRNARGTGMTESSVGWRSPSGATEDRNTEVKRERRVSTSSGGCGPGDRGSQRRTGPDRHTTGGSVAVGVRGDRGSQR
ncbi:hypothetical protein GCM10022232_58880 [Streptomyces plumbiresistens]|uniref:Uncharacterized protein n=1 Tax=Streptomyces plumbiresistens TaxID=511811 RepID=A0ABP7SD99_9ACTN